MSEQHPTPRNAALPVCRPAAPYQSPKVTDLGPWKTLTLYYSLPIGPGGAVGQLINPQGGNQ